MVDSDDLRMDNVPELDLDGEIIELTQMVDESKPLDDDIIELTEPIVDVDVSAPIAESSTGNKDSDVQVRRVLEEIIEEKYAHRMDALFSDIIHELVEKEMKIIKNSLLNALAEK